MTQGQPSFHILPEPISNDRVRLPPKTAWHQAINMHQSFMWSRLKLKTVGYTESRFMLCRIKKRPTRHQAERAVVAHYLYQSPQISDLSKPSYLLAASAERWRCRWPWRHHSWAHIHRLLRNHKLAHNRIRNRSECRWCNRMVCRRRKSDHPGNGGRGKAHGGT